MTDSEAMQRALKLALSGWGRVAPNPMVGAVLLRDGAIVGEGYHAEFGRAHAEVVALDQCDDPRGSTCVVTLEPCAHHGKTPPCVEALVNAGVERVVIAIADPSSRSAGGADQLRARGVHVDVGVGERAAAILNASFLWNATRPETPFVALKVATSLDGFLTDVDRRSQWISGKEARDYAHWLRAGYDALAVGRVTAVEDDPQLTVRGSVTPRVAPTRVIFSKSGKIPRHLNLLKTATQVPTYVVAEPAEAPRLKADVEGTGVTVLAASTLRDALRQLKTLGLASVLVEGGGALGTALLEQNLVDRLVWVQAPIWLGQGVRAFGNRSAITLDAASPWTAVEQRTLGADMLLVLDRELCLQG